MSADANPGPWPEETEEQAAESERERRQLPLPHVPVPPGSSGPPIRIRRERRAARFKVAGQFDGAPSATVTIAGGLFIVRPFGRRRVYELRLADVAKGVLFDVVKAELAARARVRAAKRGKGRP